MSRSRHQELADFLRSRRHRLTPKTVGLPTVGRRRTPGLRREELAQLAGIGVDWYVRLEQGRAVSPSSTTIDSLAKALRLGKVEHAHLRALASPPDRRLFAPEKVPPTLRRVVESLNQPAYVTGRRWDVLVWNIAAEDIFGFGRLAEGDRNTLVAVLTGANARRLFGVHWAEQARRMVTEFRVMHDLWAGDPAFQDLLERLRAGCPEFEDWWEAHDVGQSQSGRKLITHPRKGDLAFDYATFQAYDDAGLKLVIYTPVPYTSVP
jgi:transcriptional regulator with XRE-family HTH domain